MICKICGKEFCPSNGHRLYCSEACTKKAKIKQRKTYAAANLDKIRASSRAYYYRAKAARKTNPDAQELPQDAPFQTIPQAPNYEINASGVLRNKKTGKILKWQKHTRGFAKQVTLWTNGKRIHVSQPHLLWLLHGIVTAKKAPVPVSVEKGTRYLRFDTLSACAQFLAKVTQLTCAGASCRLVKRHTQIADWHINYFEL